MAIQIQIQTRLETKTSFGFWFLVPDFAFKSEKKEITQRKTIQVLTHRRKRPNK